MTVKGILFDQDGKQVVKLLLTKYATDNSGYWEYGGQIEKQIAFEVANRALHVMNCPTVSVKQKPPPKPEGAA
jgi:hypothetical protein